MSAGELAGPFSQLTTGPEILGRSVATRRDNVSPKRHYCDMSAKRGAHSWCGRQTVRIPTRIPTQAAIFRPNLRLENRQTPVLARVWGIAAHGQLHQPIAHGKWAIEYGFEEERRKCTAGLYVSGGAPGESRSRSLSCWSACPIRIAHANSTPLCCKPTRSMRSRFASQVAARRRSSACVMNPPCSNPR